MAVVPEKTESPLGSRNGPTFQNDEITNQLKTVRLKKNERIFDQGKTIDRFYLVRQGLLGIYRHVYPDKKVLVHKIGHNETTGLAQSMSDRPFPGELMPIKETVAYRGNRTDIESLCKNCPADVSRLLADENQMHDDTLQKIDDIIGKDLESRIAAELLDLGSRIGQKTDDGLKIIVKLTRKEISDMLGCAQESVIRVMSTWEKNDWISTKNGYVTLHQVRKLKSI